MTKEESEACNCDKKTKKLPHTDLVIRNTNIYRVPIFGYGARHKRHSI